MMGGMATLITIIQNLMQDVARGIENTLDHWGF